MSKKTRADLITGFLGSGKTTFIRRYVNYLTKTKNEKIAILENDYGPINVDTLLLKDLEELGVDIEMVAGATDRDCHERRFKTKLITLSMLGYDRVIIEPSGIFDIDEFLDVMRDEKLEDRYEPDNIISIVRADLESNLSEQSEYVLGSQISQSGRIILSRTQYATEEQIAQTKDIINNTLERINSKRQFTEDNITTKNWQDLTDEDWEQIANSKYRESGFTKKFNLDNLGFNPLFYMKLAQNKDELQKNIKKAFQEEGQNIFRIKGFVNENNQWYEINATRDKTEINPIKEGQDILIVIGEGLDAGKLDKYFPARFSTTNTI